MPSLGALLAGLWSRIQFYIAACLAVILAIAMAFWRGRVEGRGAAEAKQREVNDEARERMEAVKPADPGSTVDGLRKGRF